jgi:hypothetical protein
MMSNPSTGHQSETSNLMAMLEDSSWHLAADAAEESLSVSILAGVGQVGWMTTWPRLETYSEFEQLRSLVLRGFKAIVVDLDLGVGQAAALTCGKPVTKCCESSIVMARLQDATTDIQDRLLTLVDGEPLGPRVELTTERRVVVTAVLRSVLTVEDWLAIGLAAAAQVQQRVMDVA